VLERKLAKNSWLCPVRCQQAGERTCPAERGSVAKGERGWGSLSGITIGGNKAMRLKLMGLVRVVWNEVIVEQLAKGRY